MIIHCHQPVGNFDPVFEKAHKQCYGPILDLLLAHPSFRVGLHFSGPLLEWLAVNHPRTLDRMADLVYRGQVEPLSGGFFEPLLAAQPGMPRGYRIELLVAPDKQPYTPLPGLTGRADIQVFRGTLVQYLLANPEQVHERRHGRIRRPGFFDLLRGG